jgi:hypothetical protein
MNLLRYFTPHWPCCVFVLLVNLTSRVLQSRKTRITLVASISFEPNHTSPSQTPVVNAGQGSNSYLLLESYETNSVGGVTDC